MRYGSTVTELSFEPGTAYYSKGRGTGSQLRIVRIHVLHLVERVRNVAVAVVTAW